MGLKPVQVLPTEISTAGSFARQLAKILGPAYTPKDGTAAGADALAWGDALAEIKATQDTSIDQAFADTATDLLSELELQRGIPVSVVLVDSERQVNLTAAVRANFSGSPNDILAAVRTISPTALLYENLAVDVQATDPKAVFRFSIVIPEADWGKTVADNYKRNLIRDTVRRMKPGHTDFTIATRVGFRFDDPLSLFDRDVFGA